MLLPNVLPLAIDLKHSCLLYPLPTTIKSSVVRPFLEGHYFRLADRALLSRFEPFIGSWSAMTALELS